VLLPQRSARNRTSLPQNELIISLPAEGRCVITHSKLEPEFSNFLSINNFVKVYHITRVTRHGSYHISRYAHRLHITRVTRHGSYHISRYAHRLHIIYKLCRSMTAETSTNLLTPSKKGLAGCLCQRHVNTNRLFCDVLPGS